MMACPYGSRYFHSKVQSYYTGNDLTPYEKMGESQLQTGVVVKCTFCQDRIEDGLTRGLEPGVDREATPSCVNTCSAKARYFGDLDDPESEISQLIRSRRGKQLRAESGTDPSVYYLD
jgi:molybdopterin-containing oxidoreductase family iron-sulfur binding subunit